MTLAIAPCIPKTTTSQKFRLDTLVGPLALMLVGALWAICHPYSGINGDVNLYIGRAVADLDPNGVGRDLVFANDGQSKFSLFPVLAKPLVATFGVTVAAEIIAIAGSACWFAATLALARGFVSGRRFWVIVIALCVLPVAYGYPGIFSFAETSALPRPFAEAAVLGALAAILNERPAMAVGLLLVGMALHPLMTLPGIGVAVVVALMRLPRPTRMLALAACAALGVVSVILGWLGCPLFDRLFTFVDAQWFAMLSERSPHLFVMQWTAAAFPPILAQATAILVAARTAPAPQRQVLLAVLFVAAAGLAVAATLADEVHLLLFVQVQTWRVTWLLAGIGGCALAFCAPRLWARDNQGRLALALLAVSWFIQTNPIVALVLAIVTIGLEFGRPGSPASWATGRVVLCTYVTAGALVLQSFVGVVLGYLDYLKTYPVALPHLIDPLRNNLQMLPILVLTAVWLVKAPRVTSATVALLGAAALVTIGATIAGWDQTRPSKAVFESPQTPPGFAEMSAGRPQDVLWLDARGEPWFMLGRPQYLSPQQGVSMVFSRTLAVEWHRRAQRLVDLGLAQRIIFRPGDVPEDDDRLHVTQLGIDTLCHDPDAPGVVFVPLKNGDPALTLRDMQVWNLPKPEYFYDSRKPVGNWRTINSVAMVPCHPSRQAALPPV